MADSGSGAEVYDLMAIRGAARRRGGRPHAVSGLRRSGAVQSAAPKPPQTPKPPQAPPVRLTRRGRAVLVMALALLSLAGFWLGTLAAGHASAGPARVSQPWVEIHKWSAW
ncbi:hypothetical protein ACTMTF_29090 [Nonomuraea sp. ZG12]|uniref:hypothetical protein n=1 Tax=Nonomuraea sp. ZG12 TaxID=3452207 RepID=UPI003F8B3632